jgi:hypothetical protein
MAFNWWKTLASVWTAVDKILPFEIVRVIKDRECDKDYLIRYYLLSSRWMFEPLGKHVHPWFFRFSYRMVLHNTKRSDIDGLHCHPWSWGSKILQGGYFEDTPEGRFWRGPKDGWRWRKATDFHRLVLSEKPQEETWSLFVMGPREKSWGFLDPNGNWVHYQEYIDRRVRGEYDDNFTEKAA